MFEPIFAVAYNILYPFKVHIDLRVGGVFHKVEINHKKLPTFQSYRAVIQPISHIC